MPLHWYFIGLAVIISILSVFILMPRQSQLESRKKQTSMLFRENIIFKQIDSIVEKRVKFSKRYKVESICLQAGMPIKYGELIFISLLAGIALGLLAGIITTNILLALIFGVIGYLLPMQVVTFVRNRRLETMDKQVGSFMHMVLKRYDTTKDFGKAVELSAEEFKGEEPLYSELKVAINELNLGVSTPDAMDNLARRTGNVFMQRLSDYYRIASDVGTEEIRKNLLQQAYIQYDENRQGKQLMKKELAAVRREAYIMLAAIPAFAMFQVFTNDDYIRFMTKELIGQVGTAGVVIVFFGALWFINSKISAPLE